MLEIFNEQLEQILSRSESHDLDFKSADVLMEPDGEHKFKIAKNLVAFANREGGRIVFGVDDEDREPQGEPLDEEMSLGTVSTVARMDCSPPVEFSHSYFSSENGDLSEGAIFVVEAKQRGPIPHAIIENSEGEIRKREYRIRAGDESRLVSNQELQVLFNRGNFETDISESFSTFQSHMENALDAIPKRLTQPSGIRDSYIVYQGMSNEDQEYLINSTESNKFNTIATAYAFLLQFAKRFSESWLIEMDTYPSKKRWEFKTDIKKDILEIEDISVKDDDTILSQIEHDPMEMVSHFTHDGFAVPEGSKVEIQNSFIGSTITIEKPQTFHIEIQFQFSEWYPGPPAGHPVHFNDQTPVETTEIIIDFDAEFSFPDKSDTNYELHRQYAESIVDMLEKEWDLDYFYNQQPEPKLFEIEAKIDQLITRDVFGAGRVESQPRHEREEFGEEDET